jgi:catechol 2,3-dioxygenase-like lactoylglutathione lyase family enzyme
MITTIGHITILVHDQKAARDFYVNKLGFEVIEEHKQDENIWLWLVVAPNKDCQTVFTLILPTNDDEKARVGKQTGQIPLAVFLTEDCRKTAQELQNRGVKFTKQPTDEFWGVDALFVDLYGNVFDLCEPK